MEIKNSSLFFYSGTGNTYRCAIWVKEELQGGGISSYLLPMQVMKKQGLKDEEFLWGILLPVHGFTAPWPVLRFLLSLPVVQDKKAFILVTRGSTRIGNLRIPGMEGTASYLTALLLKRKGFSIIGILGVDMPSNWVVIHPPLKDDAVVQITREGRKKVKTFIHQLLKGERVFTGSIPLLLGILLFPISLLYLLWGRILLARLFFASNRCKRCGLCREYCLEEAIKMVKGRPFWTLRCHSCMRCISYCPYQAVEANHPLALFLVVVVIIIAGMVANPYLKYLIYYCGSILLISFLYHFLHHLLGHSSINHFLTKTTLTPLFSRYHEPETKVEDLVKGDNN